MSDSSVAEWVAIADGDLVTAERELRARKAPNYNSACFHAQQCAEKYLKAFMVQQDIPFKKIHDLRELAKPIIQDFAEFDLISDLLAELNPLAVAIRYPGHTQPVKLPGTPCTRRNK